MIRFFGCLLLVSIASFLVGCGKQQPKVKLPIDTARSLVFQKKYDEAKVLCDSLIASGGKDLDTLLLRGEIFEKQGLLAEAEKDYTTAIATHPENPKPYQRRQQIYTLMAEQEGISEDEVQRLRTLALSDWEDMREKDENAKKALPEFGKLPMLDKPIPAYKPSRDVVVEDKSKNAFAPDDETEAEKNALAEVNSVDDSESTDFTSTTRDENENEKVNEFTETGQEYLVRRLKEIQSPKTVEMPPHEEPETIELPEPPAAPVTTFSLPRDIGGTVLVPKNRGSVTTGITSTPEVQPEGTVGVGQDAPRLNRFFLQNQVAGQRSGVRTGIGGSSRSTVGHVATGGNFQPGFLPKEAHDVIGPRIVPLRKQLADTIDEPVAPRLPGKTPEPNSAILTTALPGTTRLFGGANASAPTGPRLGSNTGVTSGLRATQGNAAARFGKITDEGYTPFGKRPQTRLAFPSTTPN